MPDPKVTVLMAVHNGAAYVESALRSIMDQTLRDIRILVVNDGSSDETPEILARLRKEDSRLHVETMAENVGVSSAANRGLDLIDTPYVARMDSDDIALPHRLERQKSFLDSHPDILLVGTSIAQIDTEGRVFRTSLRPRDAFANRWLGRFFYPVNHPSTMFRRLDSDGVALRYREGMRSTLDYDFFAEVLAKGSTASLGEVLLQYRVHGASISGQKYQTQQAQAAKIARRIQRMDLPASVCEALEPFNRAYLDHQTAQPAEISAAFRQMLEHDSALHPDKTAFMRRQGAQMLLAALQRAGYRGRGGRLLAFGRHAPDLLPALGMRLLETRQALPRALRADAIP